MTVDDIKELYYDQKLSTQEVGSRLGNTVWQVIKFMKKNGLARRSSAETQKYCYQRKPLSFSKKLSISETDKNLLISGIMLYWAEGAKGTGSVVDLANSDPKMLMIFVKMLREIYQISEKKLRVLIYCYGNQNVEELKSFWSNLLRIPKQQFLKSYVRNDFDVKKIDKMPYGVAHLRYYDKKLYSQIQKDAAIITEDFLN